MKKTYIALIAFLFLASVGVCYAASWQSVTTITGASSTTTDYFHVPTNEWRLIWSYSPHSSTVGDSEVFWIAIYPKGETAAATDFLMKVGRNETSGTIYVHEGIKDHYLKIGTTTNYEIKIEYDSSAIPEFSPIFILPLFAVVTILAVGIYRKIVSAKT